MVNVYRYLENIVVEGIIFKYKYFIDWKINDFDIIF